MLSTPAGGKIAVDGTLLSVWQRANGRSLEEIIRAFPENSPPSLQLRAALSCLAEAGLLQRDPESPAAEIKPVTCNTPMVSVVIVGYNSRTWLPECFAALDSQAYRPIETIFVDNASGDGSAAWVSRNYPEVSVIRMTFSRSLACALNTGVKAARGEYYFLLNPDTIVDALSIGHMVAAAEKNTRCAAVAAKLKLAWAPAFLNSVGNYVGAIGWGTDTALGHLDLGQFDHWRQIPSACFAATLIPAKAWKKVGPLDEKFPLYYEDAEWCYRARLFGHSICLAPRAVVFHAFGGRKPIGNAQPLESIKLRQVVYGRLRFCTKLLGPAFGLRFLCGYLIEDLVRCAYALLRGRTGALRSYRQAWADYRGSLPELRKTRRTTQLRRQLTDRALFREQKRVPIPHIQGGLPQLTWDIVCHRYLPLLASGQTRPLPEFSGPPDLCDAKKIQACRSFPVQRAVLIWRAEGLKALLHRVGRSIQWHLMQP